MTKSYHLLPENLLEVYHNGINEVGKQVLNFSCFSKFSYDINQQKCPKITKQAIKLNGKKYLGLIIEMSLTLIRSKKKCHVSNILMD